MHITLVFSKIDYEHSLLQSIVSAMVSAKYPQKLSFACASGATSADMIDQLGDLPCIPPISFYQDTQGLSDLDLPHQTTHVLYLMGAHVFSAKWDEHLKKRYMLCRNKQAILTATIVRDEHHVPQAYLPSYYDTPYPHCYRIHQSPTALVNSLAPVASYVVDPAAVLMPRTFVESCDTTLETLSASAYVCQMPVFVLDEPLFCPLQNSERYLCIPQGSAVLTKRMENFQKLLGIHDRNSNGYFHTRLGFFHRQALYEVQSPTFSKLKQRLFGSHPKEAPLLVSAIAEFPSERKASALLRMQFAFLHALEGLSLLVFTQGSQESALRKLHPNTLNFPNLFRRQSELLDQGMTHQQCFDRAKSQLLLRALKTNTEYSHIGWVDPDLLPYPLSPNSLPNFTALMDDQIHMATVQGHYDSSFFLMPVDKVRPLVEAIEDCTYWDTQLGRNFSEITMLHRLVTEHPDWFMLHPMPDVKLLFLSLFPAPSLSESHQRLFRAHHFVPISPEPKSKEIFQ